MLLHMLKLYFERPTSTDQRAAAASAKASADTSEVGMHRCKWQWRDSGVLGRVAHVAHVARNLNLKGVQVQIFECHMSK